MERFALMESFSSVHCAGLHETVLRIVLIALCADVCLVLFTKAGAVEWLQKGRLHKLGNCRFCMGFWIALIFSLVGAIASTDIGWFVVPFCAATIIRQL
jgi:hypothetical protein